VTFARRGLDVAVLEQQTEALPSLLTAADTPVTVGANREGIGHLESALELPGEPPTPTVAGLIYFQFLGKVWVNERG